MILRHSDWQSRMFDALRQAETKRFRYGEHDCCISVCNIVRAMTGTDLLTPAQRTYRNKQEAQQWLNLYGGTVETLFECFADDNELEEVPVTKAQRGDVVIVTTKGQKALGIVDLDGRNVIATGIIGWVRVPVSRAERAWRV